MQKDLNHGQRERLKYIDFCLQFYGHIARNDLIGKFQMGLASCSRDFSTYKELAPNNLVLKHETKRYYRTDDFQAVFEHKPDDALSALSSEDNSQYSLGHIGVVASVNLVKPATEIVATIARAINAFQALDINYASLSSGKSKREIVPHSFINSGHRWHVRAFDRKSQGFRDFVCTRIVTAKLATEPQREEEKQKYDFEWTQEVELKFMPHPGHQFPNAIELDYKMENRMLTLTLKIAEAKYLLRHWNVDVTTDHSLDPNVHHLWLKNTNEIQSERRLANTLALSLSKQITG